MRVRGERENERAEGKRWRGREIEIASGRDRDSELKRAREKEREIVSERDREIASEIVGER